MCEIYVLPDGSVRYVYDEALVPVAEVGDLSIRRASNVDPDGVGRWWAYLSPSGGPALGPFGLRSEALTAEREWLASILGSVSLAVE